MAKTIELRCDYCGSAFERESREHNRSLKRGRKSYCSRSCCGKATIFDKIPEDKSHSYDISKHANNSRDEYTGMREFLRRCKARNHDVDLDLPYLKELWDTNHICPYSGQVLALPSSKRANDPIATASLDRVDSSKGYVKGNVQYVSTALNYMKGTMTHEQTVILCKTIAGHWNQNTHKRKA